MTSILETILPIFLVIFLGCVLSALSRVRESVVEEVNRLPRQHAEMKRMLKRLGAGGDPRRILRSMGR